MNGEWYYATDVEAVGPITFEALVDLARRGELKREQFVFTDGMAGWEPASSIDQLWPKQPLPVPPRLQPLPAPAPSPKITAPLTRASEPESANTIGVRSVEADNWIVRHWKGALPLWKSFWLVGVLVGLFVNAGVSGLGTWLQRSGTAYSTRVSLIWSALAIGWLVGSWQMVGLWRSAGVYASSRSAGRITLAMLTRVLVLIGCLQAIAVTAYIILLTS